MLKSDFCYRSSPNKLLQGNNTLLISSLKNKLPLKLMQKWLRMCNSSYSILGQYFQPHFVTPTQHWTISKPVRQRILKRTTYGTHNIGQTIACEAAHIVSRSSVKRWLALLRATGSGHASDKRRTTTHSLKMNFLLWWLVYYNSKKSYTQMANYSFEQIGKADSSRQVRRALKFGKISWKIIYV